MEASSLNNKQSLSLSSDLPLNKDIPLPIAKGLSRSYESSPSLLLGRPPPLIFSPLHKSPPKQSPFVGALARLHSSEASPPLPYPNGHSSRPKIHHHHHHSPSKLKINLDPSSTSEHEKMAGSIVKDNDGESEDQSVGQRYDMGMVITFLIKAMWLCETRSDLHRVEMKKVKNKSNFYTILVLLFSAITTSSIWSTLNTQPSSSFVWAIAIISTVSTILKTWGEHSNYNTKVSEHMMASREYSRLKRRIDIKLRLRRIKINDFDSITAKLEVLEFETPLDINMPVYDPEEYTKTLDKEKVFTSSQGPAWACSVTPSLSATVASRNLGKKKIMDDSDYDLFV